MYVASFAFFMFSFASATPSVHPRGVAHESREAAPSGFVNVGPAPSDQVLTLRVGLTKSDATGLEERLLDVSTPSSANYGKFLTKSEVEAYIAPTQSTTNAVTSFLSSNNISYKSINTAGDMMQIELTVDQANALFSTQFDVFKHTDTGEEATRTLQYSIPAPLQGHLAFIHPTTMFPVQVTNSTRIAAPIRSLAEHSVPVSSRDTVPSSCSNNMTISCIQELYNIPLTAVKNKDNSIGVAGFVEQYANGADLETFLRVFRPDIDPSTTFTLQTLDGGQNSQNLSEAGIEADLDVELTISLATGVPVVFISAGSNNTDGVGGFFDMINFLLAQENPPSVLTTSYNLDEDDVSAGFSESICNAYAQLGARGTTILFSSGDAGVAGAHPQLGSTEPTCTTFVPTFPCGCPYITTVGATMNVPETGSLISAGGFSNVFPRPSYQDAAVSAYLDSLGDTYAGLYNASGRAYPDISAVGWLADVVVRGNFDLTSGTSISSPVVAAIIALLNDELESAGKSHLGFLNPFLYSSGASAFNDITDGVNPGCNTLGFNATAGWDPVTGMGTPNYAALRAAVGLS